MSIRIALPVLYVTLKMNYWKGRKWSLIEHALLTELVDKKWSIHELVQRSQLPQRVVVESLVRLMRVGWVQVEEKSKKVEFTATHSGISNADKNELQSIRDFESSVRVFVVDKVTHSCFRASRLNIVSESTLNEFDKAGDIIKLEEIEFEESGIDHEYAFNLLLGDDEEYISCDLVGARQSNRHVIFTVLNGEIQNVPPSLPNLVRSLIREKASDNEKQKKGYTIEKSIKQTQEQDNPIKINFSPNRDLIIGGVEHHEALKEAVNEAASFLIIHSTFINTNTFQSLVPMLSNAADRGVRVELLWGQSEDSPSRHKTDSEIRNCELLLRSQNAGAAVNIQSFSSGSHAKLLVYDDEKSDVVAIVGSCNWLSTDFGSIEASLRLRDMRIVPRLLDILSKLSRPINGHFSPLSLDLAGYARNLRNNIINQHDGNYEVELVFAGQHNRQVLNSRDEAENKIVVGSNRVNRNAKTLVVAPMLKAIKENNIKVECYYCQRDDIDNLDDLVDGNLDSIENNNLKFHQLSNPRLHAKFLYWENNLLITSQNILSADASNAQNRDSEIGVLLKGTNISNIFREKIKKYYSNFDPQ